LPSSQGNHNPMNSGDHYEPDAASARQNLSPSCKILDRAE